MTQMSVMDFMKQWKDQPFNAKDYMRDIVLPAINPRTQSLRRVHASARSRKKATIRTRRRDQVFKNCYPVTMDDMKPIDNNSVMMTVTFNYEGPAIKPERELIATFTLNEHGRFI